MSRWESPRERIAAKTVRDGACLRWTGYITSAGYGRVKWGYQYLYVHRAIWELERGPIPEGLTIDHLCRNRACVNVDHFELVTPGENARRGVSANGAKVRCPSGHAYTEANTYKAQRGDRQCRTCLRRRREERKRMATKQELKQVVRAVVRDELEKQLLSTRKLLAVGTTDKGYDADKVNIKALLEK